MRNHNMIFAYLIIIVALLSSSRLEGATARKPVRIYRTLIRNSKFLFWKTLRKVDLLIIVYDGDRNGRYDSYQWWENGTLIFKGKDAVFIGMEPDEFEEKVGKYSKNMTLTYYDQYDCGEYVIPVFSKVDGSKIGQFVVEETFKHKMNFECLKCDPRAGTIRVYIEPSMDTTTRRLDVYAKVRTDKPTEFDQYYIEHHIVIIDADKDGVMEYYYYKDCSLLCDGPFISNVSFEKIKDKFDREGVSCAESSSEKNQYLHRVSVISNRDGKCFAYFLICFEELPPLYYWENADYSDPYLSFRERFGLIITTNYYCDYLFFMSYISDLDQYVYRDNLFAMISRQSFLKV